MGGRCLQIISNILCIYLNVVSFVEAEVVGFVHVVVRSDHSRLACTLRICENGTTKEYKRTSIATIEQPKIVVIYVIFQHFNRGICQTRSRIIS